MSDVQTAEQLWARAHERMSQDDLENAVRDLAECFGILQALGDPRMYEVHKRWVEVHQLYLAASGATTAPPQAHSEGIAHAGEEELARTEAERAAAEAVAQEETARAAAAERAAAEAAAQEEAARAAAEAVSRAEAERAAAEAASRDAWEAAARQAAEDESRLAEEFAAAEARAREAAEQLAAEPAAGAPALEAGWSIDVQEPRVDAPPAVPDPVTMSENDWSDVNADEPATMLDSAPTMDVTDPSFATNSLDVPMSVGSSVDSAMAHEVPLEGPASLPPVPAIDALLTEEERAAVAEEQSILANVSFLEDLLGRVQANRRPASSGTVSRTVSRSV